MLKIAVPTRDGLVDEHFGHCEAFTIFTVDDSKAIIAQERLTPPPGCGCKSNIIPMLIDMGVSTLIAGNMGEGAVVKLRQNGLQVFRGASGQAKEAAQAWLEGRFKGNDVICHSHDHLCDHG